MLAFLDKFDVIVLVTTFISAFCSFLIAYIAYKVYKGDAERAKFDKNFAGSARGAKKVAIYFFFVGCLTVIFGWFIFGAAIVLLIAYFFLWLLAKLFRIV